MEAQPPDVELVEIATATAPLPERAQGVVGELHRWLPSDAAWLALSDPLGNVYATAGSTGLDPAVITYLDSQPAAQEIRMTGLSRPGPPVSAADLPRPIDEPPTWAECLIPAGFNDGLAVSLHEQGGTLVGFLGLLSAGAEPTCTSRRDCLGRIAPLIAGALSPLQSLVAITGMVRGAFAGAVLLLDGTTCVLPGLEDHDVLARGSPVIDVAQEALTAGHLHRSFLWPHRSGDAPDEHVHVTVLAATDAPRLTMGVVLVGPVVDARGLTPRELEVLGLVVIGSSNQQIASRLSVTVRTVAAHVEHVLAKLEVATRTHAAVLAEREGLQVPPWPLREDSHHPSTDERRPAVHVPTAQQTVPSAGRQ